MHAAPLAHVAGTSWLHRLSPIPKLAWLVATTVVSFATWNAWPLLAIAAVGLALAASAGVARRVGTLVLLLGPLTASMVVLQAIAPVSCGGPCTPLVAVGPVVFWAEGVTHGISLASRVLAMEVVAVAVLVTTHPSDLLSALRRLRVPHPLAFMLTMTLQLVPVLQRELGIVLTAHRARGLRGRGVVAVIPALVPVFAGTFERAQWRAIALEARGFGRAGARTSYRRIAFGPVDRLLTVAAIAFGVAGTVAGLVLWSPERTASLGFPAWLLVVALVVSGVVFVGVIVAALVALLRA